MYFILLLLNFVHSAQFYCKFCDVLLQKFQVFSALRNFFVHGALKFWFFFLFLLLFFFLFDAFFQKFCVVFSEVFAAFNAI